MLTPPRYVWRELRGYPFSANGRLTSDFMVLDSWYGYEVVYYDKATITKLGEARPLPYVTRLAEVERICDRFNGEHEAEQVAA